MARDPLGQRNQQEQAEVNLATEIVKIFNNEDGNVLCFVSTFSEVNQLVTVAEGLLAHRTDVVIRGLFAALDDSLKEEITDFVDAEKFPDFVGKRLICYTTNVAEAGITINGVSAVADTGRQLDVKFDQLTRMSQVTNGWVSQACHMQRRGRAGRTAPGRCYCLFSEEQFDSEMPEYGEPVFCALI